MAQEYRVVDCREIIADTAEIKLTADTPEHAARLAIGEDLVRGSRQVHVLRARVYSGSPGALTMVRLYSKVETPHDEPIDRNRLDRWGA